MLVQANCPPPLLLDYQTCESEKGISSENVTEKVPGPEVSQSRRESGGHSRPPEANSSEMHSEPLKEAVLSNAMNGDDLDEGQEDIFSSSTYLPLPMHHKHISWAGAFTCIAVTCIGCNANSSFCQL